MSEEYDEEKKVKSLLILLGNIFLVFVLILICVSCTVNIVMTQSEDSTDAVDADPENRPDISPELTFTNPLQGFI